MTTPHPHFDDRGTLEWTTRWDDALARARAEDKLVFIEMGRLLCSQCRSLVESIVPSRPVADLLRAHFVALAADADMPEPPIVELGSTHLADATMLPFVMFVDADGRWLGGSHGAVHPDRFRRALEALVASRA